MTILIGHGGASAIAPANTIASFERARGLLGRFLISSQSADVVETVRTAYLA